MFKVLLTLVVGLFLSVGAFAQQIAIKGLVKDITGEPVIGANVLVKFGSYLNVYTATYSLEGAKGGEYITVKIPFSELTLADGSSGELDYTKVDTLQIFVKESQYCYVTIDDIGFYKD